MSKKSFCPINPDLWLEQHRQFRRLVREGLTAAEIATRVNLPIADVKQKLALYGAIPQNMRADGTRLR